MKSREHGVPSYIINKEEPACHPLGHTIVTCGVIVQVDDQVAQPEVRLGIVDGNRKFALTGRASLDFKSG